MDSLEYRYGVILPNMNFKCGMLSLAEELNMNTTVLGFSNMTSLKLLMKSLYNIPYCPAAMNTLLCLPFFASSLKAQQVLMPCSSEPAAAYRNPHPTAKGPYSGSGYCQFD